MLRSGHHNSESLVPNPNLSRKTLLIDTFIQPTPEEQPETITAAAWDVITLAVSYVQELEIWTLDALISQYVQAMKQAEGCGCPQCKKYAISMTDRLDKELKRQTYISFEDHRIFQGHNSDKDRAFQEDRERTHTAMDFGIKRLHEQKREKKLEEWDQRVLRLHELLQKVRKDTPGHKTVQLTPTERKEVRKLLLEAKARKRNRHKK